MSLPESTIAPTTSSSQAAPAPSPAQAAARTLPAEVLSVHGLSVWYGQALALRDISIAVPRNRITALIGPSGCGKTSCIQLMQRFYDPDKGHILLDGSRLDLYDRAWLRSQIGVVGQEPVLFATSIKENILLGSPHYPDGQHQDQLLMKMIQLIFCLKR